MRLLIRHSRDEIAGRARDHGRTRISEESRCYSLAEQVEPAWTMLEFESSCALQKEPSASNQAIRLEPKLTWMEVSGSAVARNAHLLLRKAIDTGGLKLTASGNLSRSVVEEMRGIIEWPDYEAKRLSQIIK